jgi:hypothetical protein
MDASLELSESQQGSAGSQVAALVPRFALLVSLKQYFRMVAATRLPDILAWTALGPGLVR